MPVDILLLGELVVRIHGTPVVITARKQRALLGLLALAAGRPLDPERLIDALWGARPPATAAKNLQVLVGRLRAALEPNRAPGADWTVLRSSAAGYCLDMEACWIDVIEFERLIEQVRRELVARAEGELEPRQASETLRRALELWRGRPFGELAYEPWAAPDVARLEELHVAAIELEVEHQLSQGRHDQLIPRLEELVATHPTRERLRAQQMLALYRAGRQAEALEAYHDARRVLGEELGIEPGRELRELQRSILAQDGSLEAPAPPTGRRLPAPPMPRTSRVGRDRELGEVRELLARDEIRQVTICGWGGVGKTRLATEVARAAGEAFAGVAWVELASVADASLVPAALEAAFEAGGTNSDPVDAVARVIGQRQLLLVLDNFEHVLGAAELVPRLLAACEHLTVLVTSRTPLGLYGEHEYALRPFEVPPAEALDDSALEADALQLFMLRAEATGSKLELNAETGPSIARICASVDGLPLGIELAAARVRLLSPAEIVERLDRRLALLTSGGRDLPDRQRSLRAAIEWSYDLLDHGEQMLFRALGVFIGGCTVQAAIAVIAPDRDEFEVLDQLESLVAKSLLARETTASGDVRLTMLESIAEFARELLAADTAEDTVRARHAAWFRDIAVAADTPKHTPDTVVPRARLRADIPNVRAAFDWALERDPSVGAEIASGLAYDLMLSASSETAGEIVGAALRSEEQLSDAALARLLAVAGEVAQRQGDPIRAKRFRLQALDLYRRIGDSFGSALTLHGLAEGAVVVENYAEAESLLRRAEDVQADDRWLQALIENQRLCVAGNLVELDRIPIHMSAAERLFGLEGDVFWSSHVVMNRGAWLHELGRDSESIQAHLEAIEGFRRGHYWQMVAHAMCNLVGSYIGLRDYESASAVAEEAVNRAKETGDLLLVSYGLSVKSLALFGLGQLEQAVEAAGEALELSVSTRRYRFAWLPLLVLGQVIDANHFPREFAQIWMTLDTDPLNSECQLDKLAFEAKVRANIRAASALGSAEFDQIKREWLEKTLDERFRLLQLLLRDGLLGALFDLRAPS